MRTRIENARLIDGTGAPSFEGDLLIEDGFIAGVGDTSGEADEVIDAGGKALCPGFIDIHSHNDFTLPWDPLSEAKILQGVTTEVVGNCGLGLMPANDAVQQMYAKFTPIIFGQQGDACSETLGAYRERLEGPGISVNAACLVPHGNLRCAAMKMEERAPRRAELRQMQELLAECMEEGAYGLSTGLVYPPGAFAETDEIIALAKVSAAHGGLYSTHMRDEASGLVESVAEAIAIGRAAEVRVQLSHHKAAGRFNWGKVERTLKMVDHARASGVDVHSDVYPYTAGSTILSAMFVPPRIFGGEMSETIAKLEDKKIRKEIIKEAKERMRRFIKMPFPLSMLPSRLIVPILLDQMARLVVVSSCRKNTQFEGKTIREISQAMGKPVFEAMLDLLVEEELAVAGIAHVMSEDDVQTVMAHPATMIGSDGFPLKDGKPHPRTYGTYPRVLEHYVKELGLLSLEEAVHRMTGMVAQKLRMPHRGVLRVGARADLVLFDPDGVVDRATYRDPKNPPLGIDHVFVSGAWTVKDGQHTGARAGRVLAMNKAN